MDCTPKHGVTSPSFYIPKIYKSTPNTNAAASNDVSYLFGESYDEKNGQESPKIQNESLTSKLKNINIEQNNLEDSNNEQVSKYLKNNNSERIQIASPSTPDFYFKKSEFNRKSNSGFKKFSPQCGIASPVKEILYPKLVPLEPLRKPLTPQKFKDKLNRIGQNSKLINRSIGPVKDLIPQINKILTVDVVMEKLFSYLNDKDLFRFYSVCDGFKDALLKNNKANERYQKYKKVYKTEKENYKITPPASPENNNLLSEGSLSPTSRLYLEFNEVGKDLNKGQVLRKCVKCSKPSIVEKSIAQCSSLRCGYIFCTLCFSSAYSPEKFYDKCQDLTLGIPKVRGKLEDLSNSSLGFNDSSSSMLNSSPNNFFSSSSLFHSSGYYSGYETSRTSTVKRNLNHTFNSSDLSFRKTQKPLFDNNRPLIETNDPSKIHVANRRKTLSIVPALSNGVRPKLDSQFIDPPSPPTVKSYTKQSRKRMLKRLTR